MHGRVLGGALQLGPGIVFGAADEISEAWTAAGDIAGRGLLVERIELQEGIIVGAGRELLSLLGGSLELLL